MHSSIYDCIVLPLSKVHNRAGNITIVERENHVPFDVKRVYYLYDIPGGENRGGHAHRKLRQLIVAASGSFSVQLNDGKNKKVVTLNRPDYGLIIEPGVWRELFEFSSGAICLVLASDFFDPSDYIRSFDQFLNTKNHDQLPGKG